jgi:hypothetical protein
MIFDDKLNLYLLEVNMSPNLLATTNRMMNKYMFENLLYNLYNLIDISNPARDHNFIFPNADVEMMVANPNSMSVKPEICLKHCMKNCDDERCKFCWKCLHINDRYDMIQTYREQMNIGDFTRLFPPDQNFLENAGSEFWNNVTEKNSFYIEWFDEMCKKNKKFC